MYCGFSICNKEYVFTSSLKYANHKIFTPYRGEGMRQAVNASHFSLNTSRLLDSLIPDTLAQDFEATNGNIPLVDVMEIGIAVVARIFAL